MELQKWANENEPKDEMIYKKGYWNQITFVRDEIPRIFCANYEEYKRIKNDIHVISDHTSKSIRLPVFQVMLPSHIYLILRYNFHNWKVSVNSPIDIKDNFTRLFNPDEQIDSIYEKFTKNAIGVIKELKKDRDYARTSALDIEQENMKSRGDLTTKMLEIEKEKSELKDKARMKYTQDVGKIKNELEEKAQSIKNMAKLIEEQEKEISFLKKKVKEKDRDELIKTQQNEPVQTE